MAYEEETGPLFAKMNTPAGMGAHPLEPVQRLLHQSPRPKRVAKSNRLIYQMPQVGREPEKKRPVHQSPQEKREATKTRLVHQLPPAKQEAEKKKGPTIASSEARG